MGRIGMTDQGVVVKYGNGLCGEENGKDRIRNRNDRIGNSDRTRNDRLPLQP
jgi:hypothetical protein